MSQHIFYANCAGRPVRVLMGWDRPLAGFFMVVVAKPADGWTLETTYLYNNLEDEESHPLKLDRYLEWLTSQGIRLPPQMILALEVDRMVNRGNLVLIHSMRDGNYECQAGADPGWPDL